MRIHTVGATLGGDYTQYRMRICRREEESALETVETERAIHGGDHGRGRDYA